LAHEVAHWRSGAHLSEKVLIASIRHVMPLASVLPFERAVLRNNRWGGSVVNLVSGFINQISGFAIILCFSWPS